MRLLLVQLRYYVREAVKMWNEKRGSQTLLHIFALFPRWHRSLNRTPMQVGLPWISYAAIELLDAVIKPEMRIFEWGVGGSTMFFAGRVRALVSVEHDELWATSVRETMRTVSYQSWELLIEPPSRREQEARANAADPGDYASAVEAYDGLSFRNYANAIDRFPDGFFQLVVVDGRVRPSCVMHAIRKITRGGYLILDDADRPRYASACAEMNRIGWKAFDLTGPGPCLWDFRQTRAWQQPYEDISASSTL